MANLPDVFRRNRGVFSDFFRDLDDLFGERSSSFLPTLFDMPSVQGRFDCRVDEEEDEYIATFEVPGFSPEEIKVDVTGNMLCVSAECDQEKAEGRHSVSRRMDRVQRTIMLPPDTNTEEIKAHYENGILHVCIPKSESSKRRSIQIESGTFRPRKQVHETKVSKSSSKTEGPRH